MSSDTTLALLPLARPTFDVDFATEKLNAMLRQLDDLDYRLLGSRALLLDEQSAHDVLKSLDSTQFDVLLILQVTFTDATIVTQAAQQFSNPLAIWAVPEPREGGRLRLNSLCGLNLASHALGVQGTSFGWLFHAPELDCQNQIGELVVGNRQKREIELVDSRQFDPVAGQGFVEQIKGKRIACVGAHPDGFTTCAYDSDEVKRLIDISVDSIPLMELFSKAKSKTPAQIERVAREAAGELKDLDQVDQAELQRSFALKSALSDIQSDGDYDAFALRCWPEMFTEYGGAVCGPVSMLCESGVPSACEADVFGAITQLLLQTVASAPVFLVDLVDMDFTDDTGVVWHCGQAPISMADPNSTPVATVHSNRKMPLLYEFPLKPGQATFARVSQAEGQIKLVLLSGNFLKRPKAFSGTSGVVQFDKGAEWVLSQIIDSGLEHHMGVVYGDYRTQLRSVAAALKLPLVEIN